MYTRIESSFTITSPTFPYRVILDKKFYLAISAWDERGFPNNWFRVKLDIIDSQGKPIDDVTSVLRNPELHGERFPIGIEVARGHLYVPESLYVGAYRFSADFLEETER